MTVLEFDKKSTNLKTRERYSDALLLFLLIFQLFDIMIMDTE